MSKRSVVTFMLMLIAGAAAPLYAQEAAAAGAASATEVAKWSIITAGFALAFAAGLAALAQGRAVSAAAEGIARNPNASDKLFMPMIYVLLIALILFFVNPFVA